MFVSYGHLTLTIILSWIEIQVYCICITSCYLSQTKIQNVLRHSHSENTENSNLSPPGDSPALSFQFLNRISSISNTHLQFSPHQSNLQSSSPPLQFRENHSRKSRSSSSQNNANQLDTSLANHALQYVVIKQSASPFVVPPSSNQIKQLYPHHTSTSKFGSIAQKRRIEIQRCDSNSTITVNCIDGDSYSFIDEGEQECPIQQQLAIAQIDPYCKHQEPDSTWLECDVQDGQYVHSGGSYGVVIFGRIVNDGQHGVYVYKNSQMKSAKGSLMDIDFQERNRIHLSDTALPVVIKLNTPDTEQRNKDGYCPEESAMEKEVRRSRIATQYKFPLYGSQVIPDLYDIQIARTGAAHSLYQFTYIQQRLEGESVYKVLRELIKVQQRSILDNFIRMFQRFEQWLTAVKQERKSNRSNSIGNKTGLKSSVAHAVFKKTFERAKKELWLRARLRLSISSLVYSALVAMWEYMIHCDSHLGNIMLVKDIIYSPEELKQAKSDGATIILGIHVYMSDTTGISIPEKIALQKGITVYRLRFDRIKWIDTAHALPVQPLLDDITRYIQTTNPSSFLYAPCAIYREQMPEDLVELQREGVDLALGAGEVNYAGLYALAKKDLIKDGNNIYKMYRTSFESYRADSLETSPLASEGEAPYLLIWRELFSCMAQMDKEIQALDSLFSFTLRRLQKLSVAQACRRARLIAIKSTKIAEVVQDSHPWSRASEIVGESCSFSAMKDAVQQVKTYLQDAANNFPSYAPVALL